MCVEGREGGRALDRFREVVAEHVKVVLFQKFHRIHPDIRKHARHARCGSTLGLKAQGCGRKQNKD